MRVILASTSPRRQQLLKAAGFELKIIAPLVNEALHEDESPEAYVRRLAKAKADFVSQDIQIPVVAADTVVVCDNRILGKPIDENDASSMLQLLSGKEHIVLTGFAVRKSNRVHVQVVSTKVVFRPLSREEIAFYVLSKEPFGKAGAYAIQGQGATLIDRVDGSLTNVIGLPIKEVVQSIRNPSI